MIANRVWSWVVCAMLLLSVFSQPFTVSADATPAMTMNSTGFIRGETIVFTTENTNDSMHVSILIAGYTNYTYDTTGAAGGHRRATLYCTSNTLTFDTQKLSAGNYVAVLFGDGWKKYQEIAFTVSENPAAPSFTMNGGIFNIGDIIQFSCQNVNNTYNISILYDGYKNYNWASTGGDRVATILCNSPNLTYNSANLAPGKYVAVLFAEGWVLHKEIVFEVKDLNDPKSFTLDKTTYVQGEPIVFTFHNTVRNDYVALFAKPVNYANTRYGLHYLTVRETSYTYFSTNMSPGEYSAVLFDNTGSWNRIQEVPVTILAAKPAKTLSLSSPVVGIGSSFTFVCENAEDDDFIAICPADYTDAAADALTIQAYDAAFSAADLAVGEYVAVLLEKDNTAAATYPFSVVSYHNDGTTLVCYETLSLDLSAEPHDEPAGKLFLGWKDQNGAAVAGNGVLPAGTVLKAQFTDYNTSIRNKFTITGVQMRTAGEQALRFVVTRGDDLAENLPIIDYGTLLLPSIILNDCAEQRYSELVYDAAYTYNGQKYSPAVVLGKNTYSDEADTLVYTLCITNITAAKYRRQYTARGFIRYTDLNGFVHILYTDPYSTNLYAAAKHTLKFVNGSAEAIVKSVIDTADEATRLQYDSEKEAVVGSEQDPNTWIYRLKDSSIYVREVSIDSGRGGRPINIVQLTDLHLNSANLANTVPVTRRIMDYAAASDQLVITGDVIENLTDANLSLVHREVWDVAPDALIALGNHDFVDRTGLSLSTEQCYDKLQSSWKHDIVYASRVIDDKVMVIQMDNGASTFRQDQVEPLRSDLAVARENDYVVLLFVHISLCTRNPQEASVSSLRGDTVGRNFYTNSAKDFVGAINMAEGANKDVYELILNNADVIKGVFSGHAHTDFYTEICAKTADGQDAIIPQYTLDRSVDDGGHVLVITVQ